ncbi:MAG: hypothetical protein KatS3mg002_0726 [Candidatus Woesearchaeota archaeon]|nr:MAG: hypothetical protein KatS3mg002_0726 [Candidatus Woesearchaeota archaeon]
MGYVFISPKWFLNYSIILEIIFAVITLIVSYYAFKVYKLTEKESAKLFSTAFIFIFLSYLIQSILNIIILYKLDNDVVSLINLRDAALLNLFGLYLHALFFIMGLIILAYIQFKVDNIKIAFLLIAVIITSILFSWNKLMLFYMLSAILLVFIVINYFINYLRHKTMHTFMVLLSMIFLLLGVLYLFFSVDYEIYYVIGHILEFIAYIIILINLFMMIKHGKKKR